MKHFFSFLPISQAAFALLSTTHLYAAPSHEVILQGNGKLAIVDGSGKITWEREWGGIHDIHVLPNGNIMVQENMRKVVEIDRATKEIVWEYDSGTRNGNEGKRVEVHAFQPLENGHVMIAESGPGRLIEVDREGTLQRVIDLRIENPDPHTDTRLVRKTDADTYLVCHEADGKLREYDQEGRVVWEFEVPLFGKKEKPGHGLEAFGNRLFGAVRLPDGNTLISTGNGHSVIEVTPDKEIVWELHQDDLPDIRLAWVTTLEVLPDGHLVIGNCHAGPGNPLLIEIDRKTKDVVWTFDHYETFGNSVPNSQLLDVRGKSIR